MTKIRCLFSLALPALAFTAVNVDGEMNLTGGYRVENYRQVSQTPGDGHFKDFGSTAVELNGRMVFNHDFFFRGYGIWGFAVRDPSLLVGGTTTIGEKKYSFDIGGAVGWQFDLAKNQIRLTPEFGYGYSRLKFSDTFYLAVGAPFVGMGLGWAFTERATLDFNFDYLFTGSRREIFHSGTKLVDGSFQGPKASLHLNYLASEHISMGVGYAFRYLFSNERNFTGITAEKTKWTSHYGSFDIGYIF